MSGLSDKPDRRRLLVGAGALGIALTAGKHATGQAGAGNSEPRAVHSGSPAEPDRAAAERLVSDIIGTRPLRKGLLTAITPDIAENGSVVPVTFGVNCSMTGDDYPEIVHVFALDNPNPHVAKYHFTPACGEARVSFRCRMRTTSHLVFVAEMGDGTVGMEKRWVDVTVGACG